MVERTLGKGEAESSILSCGTMTSEAFAKQTQPREIIAFLRLLLSGRKPPPKDLLNPHPTALRRAQERRRLAPDVELRQKSKHRAGSIRTAVCGSIPIQTVIVWSRYGKIDIACVLNFHRIIPFIIADEIINEFAG